METLGKLAQMTVGYYDGLPPELVTPRTQINRAMALVREGAAQNASGKMDAAYKSFDEAQAVFEKLRAAGDHSEAVTYGLALTLYSKGSTVIGGANGRGTAAAVDAGGRPVAAAGVCARWFAPSQATVRGYLELPQPHASVAGNGGGNLR